MMKEKDRLFTDAKDAKKAIDDIKWEPKY